MIQYHLASSVAAFDKSSAVLVSEDFSAVFVGHALSLAGAPSGLLGPDGPGLLSRFFSEKSGAPMTITWGGKGGPSGTLLAEVLDKSPYGQIQMPGALTRDGQWFLFGSFFPLDKDPREERLRALGLEGRPSLGPPSAPVTVVEFSDYGCPNCAALQPVLQAAIARHPGEVRLIRFDWPQWKESGWPMTAAECGRCVWRLAPNAFWAFEGGVFERRSDLTAGNFDALTKTVIARTGIQEKALQACMRQELGRRDVIEDLDRAARIGISGVPTVLVNGALLDLGIDGLIEPAIAGALSERSGAISR